MRLLTTEQKAFLRSPNLKANLLITFFLDEGTYRFCDDIIDLTDDGDTYIGASSVLESIEVRSGSGIAAEPIVLKLDAQRMAQYGIQDPAYVLRDTMDYITKQRRVDLALGLSDGLSAEVQMKIPLHAGKINYKRLAEDDMALDAREAQAVGVLEIYIDSLAMRYSRAPNRLRTHEDQQRLFPNDKFFSFVAAAARNEQRLRWGK